MSELRPTGLGTDSPARGAHSRRRAPARPRQQTAADGEAKRSEAAGRQAWIGVDVSKEAVRPAPRGLYPLLAVAVLAALAIAAVRVDLLRTRYAVAAVLERENELIEAQRQLIVRRRQLRDPVALEMQARERGFRPPAQVVSLPDPPMDPLDDAVRSKPVIEEAALAAASAAPVAGDPVGGSEWR